VQTLNNPKYRSSTGPKNRNQTVWWVAVALVALGLVWLWWGQQKPSKSARKKVVEKTNTAQTSTSNALPDPLSTKPVVLPPPPVAANLPEVAKTTPLVTNTPSPVSVPVPAPVVKSVAPVENVATNLAPKVLPPRLNKVLDAQLALTRAGISPGSIDGVLGSQTRSALRAFQLMEGLPVTGALDTETELRLLGTAGSYSNYVVSAEDMARLIPLSNTWLGKSQQERLDYETILELVAERFQSHPALIQKLNPGLAWSSVGAGTTLVVPVVERPAPASRAAYIKIYIGSRFMEVFAVENTLLAHFPCSIAQRVEKRPIGEELHVAVVAPNPNYTFDPAVFPESAEAQQIGHKLILQPGPNNPVGTVWIGLDKPGYGIHGTPHPEAVGRTESHGCFRLANWNAEYLLKLVNVGTPVYVEP
jgi:lipoprotein-anchoring transpeptidase ErfK/SrfK